MTWLNWINPALYLGSGVLVCPFLHAKHDKKGDSPVKGSGNQDDFSDVVARFHHGVSFPGFFQRESRMDDGADFP